MLVKTMAKLFDHKEICEMVISRFPPENFGPNSAMPYLAIDLRGTSGDHTRWLKNLPCPTIGVGEGTLATACDVLINDQGMLGAMTANIEKAPMASMILVQHLRASESLNFRDALTAESFAYATVQRGPEFIVWLQKNDSKSGRPNFPDELVKIESAGDQLSVTLNDPENHNAIGVKMRDALCEGLDLALADPAIEKVSITGTGRTFSIGGDVDEFGNVTDSATAHWIRSLRLPAQKLVHLREKLFAHVNGAAVGAGAEIAGFASRLTASPDAWFQLPELKYGLIPGAGGTVSLPRRIGRQKTAYMALSMKRISAQTALEWGLVDEILS